MVDDRKNGSLMKPKTYTKRDISQRVAQLISTKPYVAEKWVDAVFTALRDIMTTGGPSLRIEIRDFGIFEVKRTKPKPKARNPRTGETIYVPARRKTHFKPSKLLRSYLQRPLEQTDSVSSDTNGFGDSKRTPLRVSEESAKD
jgi:integration host factor subunit beta